jgi:hypothetical protein
MAILYVHTVPGASVIGVGKINQTCLCGSIDFDRVNVERPDGTLYVTAFRACRRCGVMYHSPPRPDPPAPPPYKGPLFTGRDFSPKPVSALTPEQERELMEAVMRANKSKRKGMRG